MSGGMGEVPERLRHVFDFYGIPNLAERLNALSEGIIDALRQLPEDGVRRSDLSTLVADRSGLSEVFRTNVVLRQAYTKAFETALVQLETNGQIARYGDFVVPHEEQSRDRDLVSPRARTQASQQVTHETRRPESEHSRIRPPSHHAPSIPDLPEALPVEAPQFAEIEPEPLDDDAKRQLAILTNEEPDEASLAPPDKTQRQTATHPGPSDPLKALKALIEDELGVQVQKRLNELSISEIVPGWSCDCTLSLESNGTELTFKAVLPLVIDCATELLEMAEAERLRSNLGIATVHGDRVLIIRSSVDMQRHEQAEVHALSAKVLQEVLKIAGVMYDGERFRHKSGAL